VKVSAVYVSSFGLLSLYTEGEPALMVEVAGGEAEILVVDGGRMEFSHTAPLPEGLTAEGVADEVDRALLAYAAKSPGKAIRRVLLAGEGDEAVAAFRQAVHAAPDLWEARYGLGYALLKRGELDEAERELRLLFPELRWHRHRRRDERGGYQRDERWGNEQKRIAILSQRPRLSNGHLIFWCGSTRECECSAHRESNPEYGENDSGDFERVGGGEVGRGDTHGVCERGAKSLHGWERVECNEEVEVRDDPTGDGEGKWDARSAERSDDGGDDSPSAPRSERHGDDGDGNDAGHGLGEEGGDCQRERRCPPPHAPIMHLRAHPLSLPLCKRGRNTNEREHRRECEDVCRCLRCADCEGEEWYDEERTQAPARGTFWKYRAECAVCKRDEEQDQDRREDAIGEINADTGQEIREKHRESVVTAIEERRR
jgi:hypothetical protein